MQTLKKLAPCLSFAACALAATAADAGEGMWLPEQLPALADDLRAQGLQLDPTALADLDAAPLNAIISLGGCSASFVSSEGLVVTNHHCAVGALQRNSSPESNLLEDGHYARTRSEEVWAGPGSRVYVTRAMTDVTDAVHGAMAEAADDRARFLAADAVKKELVAACEETPGRRCQVATYDGGRAYRLIEQLEIEDVRIVYAPEHMVGFFGGDTDNWMWPRHAGDFTFFRAYVGQDGEPASHSEDNVPYQPESWLTVSTEPVDEGDFVMVAGYPGRTRRNFTGDEMRRTRDHVYPWNIATMDAMLAILDAEMEADEQAAVFLNGMRFGLANYHKNNHGMLDSFVRTGAVEQALARDAQLREHLAALETEEGAAHLAAYDELHALLEASRLTADRDAPLGWMNWGVNLLSAANTAVWLAHERMKPDAERDAGYQERDEQRLIERMQRVDYSFWEPADRAMLTYFADVLVALEGDLEVAPLRAWADAHGGVEAAVAATYEATTLGESDARMGLLSLSVEELEGLGDPIVDLALAMYPMRRQLFDDDQRKSGALQRLRPVYLEALQAWSPREVSPDANGTLRVTYGLVRGYTPRDGVWYPPHTTVAGVPEKHTGEGEFDAPDALLDAISAGEWGRWAHPALGSVPIDFLSTLDTTGGNSGSATLNARGELCGLLFDGNYESMASDWLFDSVMTRSIHVHIVYALWMAEYVHGMSALLEELGVD